MNYFKITLVLIVTIFDPLNSMERPIKRSYQSNHEEQHKPKRSNFRAIFYDPRLFIYMKQNYAERAVRKNNIPGE